MTIKQKLSKFRVDFWIWIIGALYGYKKNFLSLVSAQAMFETGRFEGRVWTKGNNAFGMQRARLRKQYGFKGTNEAGGEPWVIWSCPFYSVLDQFRYFKAFNYSKDISNAKEFASTLKLNQYYQSNQNDYEAGIKQMQSEYPINSLGSVVVVSVLAVVIPLVLIVGIVRLILKRSFIWKFWTR